MSKWLLSFCLIALVGSAGVTVINTGQRGRELELRQADQTRELAQLTQKLLSMQSEVNDSIQDRVDEQTDQAAQQALEEQIQDLESQLLTTRVALDEQSLALVDVAKRQDRWMRNELGKRMEEVNRDMDERWGDVSQTLEATVQIAEQNRDSFKTLRKSVDQSTQPERDVNLLWADLMGPTVQISDDTTVGSGTLLSSTTTEAGTSRTHVLTAWHVIRDILGSDNKADERIEVFVYHEDSERTREWARLVAHDVKLDTALLILESTKPMEHGARLPSRAKLKKLSVFSPIYAVGCPLGNNPIPTRGELSDTHHRVDGNHYWMINAPTYIGNSGGGIFDSQSHEFLGIFSKIYTHGSLRPTVVPHMGLVTPLTEVYDWLEEIGQSDVLAF